MTGRVYSRAGVPALRADAASGLPLREVTLADQFRTAGYETGMLGKWHLGQREAYLPASRGFDSYLGIPFSDDMGAALSDCGNGTTIPATVTGDWSRAAYAAHGYTQALRFEDEARTGRAAESAGSVGHLYARSAGYWNVGKGSTWEGGIREPAFVSWKGVARRTPSPRRVSSTDVFPTLSELIGAPLPTTLTYNGSSEPAIYDGVDQSSVWFDGAGRPPTRRRPLLLRRPHGADAPSAARWPYKLHYATGPGLAGCDGCEKQYYDPPMVFQVEVDPSEHRDAAIDFQCFDWDRRQDHEVVFTGETLRAWPASNEQFRWDDRDEPTRRGAPRRALTPATRSRAAASRSPRGGPEDGELDDLADLLDGEDDLSDLLGDDDDDDDDDAPAAPPPAGEVVASALLGAADGRFPRRRRARRRRRGRLAELLRMGEAGGDAASLEAEWQRRKEEMDSTRACR
ncbi:sulfuric ester hydrolase [Aureococcus anophagefferens]|nr:sulfuric ester hydrolase [Aureococcus anophagefferens]